MRQRPLIPLQTRAKLVLAVFSAIVLLAAVSMWSEWTLIDFLKDVSPEGAVDEARADAIDERQRLIGILQIVSRVLGAVVFLNWFHAAHKNLGSSRLERLTYTPASAVWGFFIPILSLFRPYQVMAEVSKGSSYLAGASGQGSWRQAPAGPLVGVWWGLYLAAQITGTISARMTLSDSGIDTYVAAGWLGLASDLLDVPAAIAAMLLVRTISEQQAAAREHPIAEVFE